MMQEMPASLGKKGGRHFFYRWSTGILKVCSNVTERGAWGGRENCPDEERGGPGRQRDEEG